MGFEWPIIFHAIIMVCSMMTVLWGIAVARRNAGWVDLGWVLGLALTALYYASASSGDLQRRMVLAFMVLLWAVRLGGMLLKRLLSEGEDPRYLKVRDSFGPGANVKFFAVFQMQALLDIILAVPFLLICVNPTAGWHAVEWLGIGVWILGFIAEAWADAQLRAFKKDPANRGKVCEKGLWYFSRHPNYFFEWVMWVGYFLFALATPWGWVSIISPVLMLYFLLKVSGVPLAEEQSLKSRGDAFRQYQRTTSVFIPLPKRVF